MNELKQITAKNIAELRVKAHLTQYELGEKLNYSDKAVSRWERGEAVPDAYVLLMMAEIFSVSVDYLLKEHSPEEEEEAMKALAKSQSRVNRKRIILVSFLGVWALAILFFVVTAILGKAFWLFFIYAIPVSSVVMVVLISLWGDKRLNILFLSLLVWGSLLSLHLTLLPVTNLWMLYLLGIPAQVIIPLSFTIRRSPSSVRKKKKKEDEEEQEKEEVQGEAAE